MPHAVTVHQASDLLSHRRDLLEQGWSDHALASAVASGRLRRVRRGWYVSAVEWEGLWPEGRHLVHVLAVARSAQGEGSVLMGASAAVVHGLPLYRYRPARVEVATPLGRRHAERDIARHAVRLPDGHITTVHGLRVTTVERTAADLARVLPLPAAVSVADASLRSVAVERQRQDEERADAWRALTMECLHVARGSRGVRQGRRVIEFADGRAQLPGESVSRLQLHRIGFRRLELQTPVPGPDGETYFVDFGLEEAGVWGEFDGEGKYLDESLRSGRTAEEVVLDEKRREDWIRGTTGRRVVRWGDEEAADPTVLRRRLIAFGVRPPR